LCVHAGGGLAPVAGTGLGAHRGTGAAGLDLVLREAATILDHAAPRAIAPGCTDAGRANKKGHTLVALPNRR